MRPDEAIQRAELLYRVERLRENYAGQIEATARLLRERGELRAEAERLAAALKREVEQSADGGLPESLAALRQHEAGK